MLTYVTVVSCGCIYRPVRDVTIRMSQGDDPKLATPRGVRDAGLPGDDALAVKQLNGSFSARVRPRMLRLCIADGGEEEQR